MKPEALRGLEGANAANRYLTSSSASFSLGKEKYEERGGSSSTTTNHDKNNVNELMENVGRPVVEDGCGRTNSISLCVLSQAYNLKQAVKPTIRIRVASSTSPANVLGKEPETEPEERKEEGDNHGEATEKRELYTIVANNRNGPQRVTSCGNSSHVGTFT
ncbi:hypothetical protein V1477_018432 [Vespula maculifrons]|uniref:Uncharacterized protein n=1 Tax=Vespula maculifrons TaxID=7453 RepID=A0ABD2AVD6_VESMC